MNKTLLFAAIAAAVSVGAIPTTAAASDGQINFTGTVLAQTCTVNGNATGNPVVGNLALPDVQAATLVSSGAIAGATPFTIVINGCDSALSTVATQFSGSNIDSATGNLKNTAAGGATNVQLQLLNSDKTVINLRGATAAAQGSKSAALVAGAATLAYIAQYRSLGNASAGAVASNVQFTMIYQ